jgi:hypothetical protein
VGGGGTEGEYVCFFYKFISYVASYLGPIQTGFLMTFLPRFRQNRNRDSCSKRATGMKKKESRGFLQGGFLQE